ncbi:MAG: hypothetical protein Q9174_004687 [Haloplaca sp. 1 TL-2023]
MVFDITRPQMYTEISGATTLTKLARVEFGRTPDELMVFSDFGFKMQIWSLTTKRAVEIKDPKSCSSSFSYRPKTGHLALLTRPAAHDVLLILAPNTYDILGTWELGTVDARGIAYSPDGNWIAVWDTASAGCRVLLLTADGHHFKNYSLPEDDLNLGISNVQWNPSGECLAVGDHDGKITLLRANTFVPQTMFSHPATFEAPGKTIWQEEIGQSLCRSYTAAPQPAESPSVASFPATKEKMSGVTLMKFNASGTLLASRDAATPSTLWIHSVHTRQLFTALIHHSPIKSIRWHNHIEDLLLIQCAIPEPIVHVWKASWSYPQVVRLPLKAPLGQTMATWLSFDDHIVRLMLNNNTQSAIGQIRLDGQEMAWKEDTGYQDGLGPEDMFDEGNSIDLSPVKPLERGIEDNETPALGLSTQLGHSLEVEDTFQFRRQGQAAT